MTVKQLIGWCLVASPFVALFIYITAVDGILAALGTFAITAAVLCVVGLGVWLAV